MRQANNGLRKVCACPRRVWAKCPHPWHFSFKWAGVHHRFSLDRHLGRHVESKIDATKEADRLRTEIRQGSFGQPTPRQEMTLRQLADVYLERHVRLERASTEQAFTWSLNTICRTVVPVPTGGSTPLGQWRIADIVTDTIERFREARRGETGTTAINRNLALLRALFNWAVRTGYVERTPFKRATETAVRLSPEHPRARRLDADHDEQGQLLAVCGPHLRAVVEAALETGMRRGEILSLQWHQVEGMKVEQGRIVWASRSELVLPWAKTKTRRDRRIPISSRLRALLDLRRFDPDGRPHAGDRFVFGNELGQRVRDVKRAWMTAVLKANGHKPTFTTTANLTAASRAAYDTIDLHFHDLRREAGSRWLEGGVPLHTVRDWLGHTSIAQTSTYLAGTMRTQHDAMRHFEERRASLQRFATDSGTEGRRGDDPAEGANRNPNKTAVDLESTIM